MTLIYCYTHELVPNKIKPNASLIAAANQKRQNFNVLFH